MSKLIEYAGADGLDVGESVRVINVKLLGEIYIVEMLQGETEDDAFYRFMNSLSILACVDDSTHEQ
jgi:hypothetical protein